MKKLLLSALLLSGLAGCGTKGPKFRNPVVVTADNTPIHETMDQQSSVLVIADKGDTLEFDGVASKGLVGPTICQVMPNARLGRFKNGAKSGYIERRFLAVPDSTLTKDKAGALHELPLTPSSEPEHLNKR